MISTSNMLFYGCIGTEVGHYLLDAQGGRPSYHQLENKGPKALKYLDGGFLALRPERGVIYRSLIPGWTIIALIDNSVDTRPGSNAAFLWPGEHTVEEMVTQAKEAFPEITRRLGWR